jgi:hypothetical protein
MPIQMKPPRAAKYANFLNTRPFGADTPFGNLNPIALNVLFRMDEANRCLREACAAWCSAIDTPEDDNAAHRHRYYSEYTISQLSRVADTLIGLATLVNEHEKSGTFPRRIAPDSIGRLLHKDYEAVRASLPWHPHIDLLELLNGLYNAQKHHLVYDESVLSGRNEPLFIGLAQSGNNSNNKPQNLYASFSTLASRYNIFFDDTWHHLLRNSRGDPELLKSRSSPQLPS